MNDIAQKVEWQIGTTDKKFIDIDKKGFHETTHVCRVSGKIKEISEMESQAKLISAAPDMLSVLIHLRSKMLEVGVTYDNADQYNMIDAAINKATK